MEENTKVVARFKEDLLSTYYTVLAPQSLSDWAYYILSDLPVLISLFYYIILRDRNVAAMAAEWPDWPTIILSMVSTLSGQQMDGFNEN